MNKLKGIILVVSICFASIMMPFNIYADTIDSHIRGRNYTYEPITYTEFQVTTTQKYYQNVGVFHITFELDDEYIGYILPNYTLQFDNYFYGASDPYWGTLSKTFNRRIFVNGSSFTFDITINWNSINVNTANAKVDPYFYDSYTIVSSDVTKYADIDSLDQIVNILTDLYNSNDQVEGLLNNQLSQLQQIVSNTSLANQYLDTISKLRQYNFPLESFNAVSYMFNKYEIIDYVQYGSWIYPLFNVPSNSIVGNIYFYSLNYNITRYFICLGKFHANQNPFTFENGTLIGFDEIFYNQVYGLWRFRFSGSSNGSGFTNIITNRNISLCPIYLNLSNYNKLSTDFALQYGLSNQLLDDIHIIANGSSASNNASQQLESDTSVFNTDRDDLIDIEDSMGNNMDSAMNQITPNNNGLSGFGGNFLTSAVWVRTQFERLTNNTPYGSLIVYGMTLGLALLLLGKVML